MDFSDLKRSNAVYIFRTIMHEPRSLKEISLETNIAEITIKKIIYKLIEENIVSKCTQAKKSLGRPIIYLTPNPQHHSIFISENKSNFIFYTINTRGERKRIQSIPKNECLEEELTLEFAYNLLKQDKTFKFCQGTYLISANKESYKEINGITKANTFSLIASSLVDEESSIFLEFGENKAVINHGKIKFTDKSKEDVLKIIDIDEEYIFNDLDENKAINEALRILTLKRLEEKVAQLFC